MAGNIAAEGLKLAVQVNGKVKIASAASKEDIQAAAMTSE